MAIDRHALAERKRREDYARRGRLHRAFNLAVADLADADTRLAQAMENVRQRQGEGWGSWAALEALCAAQDALGASAGRARAMQRLRLAQVDLAAVGAVRPLPCIDASDAAPAPEPRV